MKRMIYVFVFCICSLSFSCNNKPTNSKDDVNWKQYPVMELVKPQTISVLGQDFLDEQRIHLLKNDSLFFCSPVFAQTGEVHLYKLKDDTLKWVCEMIRRGNGPWETAGHSAVGMNSSGEVFVEALGYAAKAFRITSLDDTLLFDKQKWDVCKFPSGIGNVVRMLPINSDRFLVMVVGDFPSLLACYELSDSILSYVKFPYPNDGYNNISRTMVYSGNIKKQPQGNKFIYNSPAGKYMFVFELEESEMKNIKYLYNIPPQYNLAKDGVMITSPKDETSLGGMAHVTDKYIYVKMSDFRWKDFMDGSVKERNGGFPNWFTNKIYVYDWNANPIKSLQLDMYVSNFVVDSKDEFIYAITKDLETDDVQLVKYCLQ